MASVAEAFADAARRSACGEWKKPMARIYDYNQGYGTNYYRPMVDYIKLREVEGSPGIREEVYLPDRCELTSNRPSAEIVLDESPAEELEKVLTQGYKSHIRELHGNTASSHRLRLHNSTDNTFFSRDGLLGYHMECNNDRRHYRNELAACQRRELQRQEDRTKLEAKLKREREMRMHPQIRHKRWQTYSYLTDPLSGSGPVPLPPEPIDEATAERVKDVRAKMYWIYKPRTIPQLERWLDV